jgi:hypothetical protein
VFYSAIYYYFEVLGNWFQAGSRSIDLELTTLSSANHIEMTPTDAGFQDRYIVQEIIKEMTKNRPIDTKGKKGFKGNSLFLLSTYTCVLLFCSEWCSIRWLAAIAR